MEGKYVEYCWNDTDREKTQVLREIPIPLQFCPSQIQKGLNWNRHQSCTVTAWSLTAWIMKGPES